MSTTLPAGPVRRRRHGIARCARLSVTLLWVMGAAGCAFVRGNTLRPGSEPTEAPAAWPRVLIAAQSDMEQGHHAAADKRLREFIAEYARTTEAVESTYWRAVFMLDPANSAATPREAMTILDRYLASSAPLQHRSEATVLQRVARALATREAAAPAPSAVRAAPDPAREAEIKALKDELEQTKAELERIRKRLAPPPAATPPPPLPDAK